jgi:hypothetical protein
MYAVLLGEFLGKWLSELEKIGERILDDLRTRRASQEEASLGVLNGFGRTLLDSA